MYQLNLLLIIQIYVMLSTLVLPDNLSNVDAVPAHARTLSTFSIELVQHVNGRLTVMP